MVPSDAREVRERGRGAATGRQLRRQRLDPARRSERSRQQPAQPTVCEACADQAEEEGQGLLHAATQQPRLTVCAPYVGVVRASPQQRGDQLLTASPALLLAARQEPAAERDRHRRARLLLGGTSTLAKCRERRLQHRRRLLRTAWFGF